MGFMHGPAIAHCLPSRSDCARLAMPRLSLEGATRLKARGGPVFLLLFTETRILVAREGVPKKLKISRLTQNVT